MDAAPVHQPVAPLAGIAAAVGAEIEAEPVLPPAAALPGVGFDLRPPAQHRGPGQPSVARRDAIDAVARPRHRLACLRKAVPDAAPRVGLDPSRLCRRVLADQAQEQVGRQLARLGKLPVRLVGGQRGAVGGVPVAVDTPGGVARDGQRRGGCADFRAGKAGFARMAARGHRRHGAGLRAAWRCCHRRPRQPGAGNGDEDKAPTHDTLPPLAERRMPRARRAANGLPMNPATRAQRRRPGTGAGPCHVNRSAPSQRRPGRRSQLRAGAPLAQRIGDASGSSSVRPPSTARIWPVM